MTQSLLVKALFAYLHYISFVGIFVTLIVELLFFKPKIPSSTAKILQKTDGLYGLFAILVVTTGLLRVFFFEKGSDYYFSNYIFLIKLGLFIVVGILSIWPTVYFSKWKKDLKEGHEYIETGADKYNRLRLMIRIEVALVTLLPLLAVLMARGYGF